MVAAASLPSRFEDLDNCYVARRDEIVNSLFGALQCARRSRRLGTKPMQQRTEHRFGSRREQLYDAPTASRWRNGLQNKPTLA